MRGATIRKTYLVILGTAMVVTGLALLVMPGPGLIVVAVGLTVLASAGVLWAAQLLVRTRARAVAPAAGKPRTTHDPTSTHDPADPRGG